MQRIAIVDFLDRDIEPIAITHTNTDADAIYADVEEALAEEGYDTIVLHDPEEVIRNGWMTREEIDRLITLASLA
jgi:hypothetical protein